MIDEIKAISLGSLFSNGDKLSTILHGTSFGNGIIQRMPTRIMNKVHAEA